ncbi:MAG: hypothetical protein JXK05_00200 [Campylobacterales bacterium]|nr:hypothetical protein [Campylobacterales bacterium]
MTLDKKSYNIYLVSAVIVAALVYMGISAWMIHSEVMGKTSADLAKERLLKP